ncbi:DUF3631 domain-containing protein [Actinokineospora diospyrosa]|uniref:DUF3631 domain-containing protein n=1 Tax=Actinokineospora diospyrosa TaxID=103728 RepID=A0ABT1I711_9PSEU|nr:DUF3631 domain-containing protein [Actinokineospora diospyrosa]MCP2268186.1 Protein of unknown function (DUF3631) [Actinokineospora diospyrosa]
MTSTAPVEAGQSAAELLDSVNSALARYVVLPTLDASYAITLWIAATHAQPAWAHAPRLVIRAPEKRCGKSRLLDLIEAMCHDPFITVNASTSSIYRSVTDDPPTLLVDEADTIFGPRAGQHEDLRGLLNAGHQRNRPIKRYNAETKQVESLPTFAMAALAGIGAMPGTIEDRAVIVRMRRRLPNESTAPFRHRRDRPALRELATQLNKWVRTSLDALELAVPDMPVEDRAADTWEPLVIIADHAGGDWPDRARAAVLALTAEHDADQETSLGVRLLTDCRAAFGDDAAVSTTSLLDRLKRDPEGPWAAHGPVGMTPAKLADYLREYDIRSGNVRFSDGSQAKGYKRVHFGDAWQRYCPTLNTNTPAAGTLLQLLPLEGDVA